VANRDLNDRGPADMTAVGPSDMSMRTHRVHLLRALRRRRGERGQAIIEFAMVLPFLAALILIFVSFGKAVYYYIELTHAANEGAREASVNLPNAATPLPGGATSLKSYICNQFGTGSELFKGSGTVSSAAVGVGYSADPTPRAVGEPITVNVSTNYSWFPFMNLGTFKITGSATMRIEQDTSTNTKLDSGPAATCS
jgi:Flp pilus assembly protein TadG